MVTVMTAVPSGLAPLAATLTVPGSRPRAVSSAAVRPARAIGVSEVTLVLTISSTTPVDRATSRVPQDGSVQPNAHEQTPVRGSQSAHSQFRATIPEPGNEQQTLYTGAMSAARPSCRG